MIAVGVADKDAAVGHDADIPPAGAYFEAAGATVGVDLPGRDVVLFGDGVNGGDLRAEVSAFELCGEGAAALSIERCEVLDYTEFPIIAVAQSDEAVAGGQWETAHHPDAGYRLSALDFQNQIAKLVAVEARRVGVQQVQLCGEFHCHIYNARMRLISVCILTSRA